MKLSRASYPTLFGITVWGLISGTISLFSDELHDQLVFPLLIVGTFLILIGIIIAIKDGEIIKVITDERTRRVDRSATYYSWWFTLIFIFVFGIIASYYNYTPLQLTIVIFDVLWLSFLILHIYFNFWGKF